VNYREEPKEKSDKKEELDMKEFQWEPFDILASNVKHAYLKDIQAIKAKGVQHKRQLRVCKEIVSLKGNLPDGIFLRFQVSLLQIPGGIHIYFCSYDCCFHKLVGQQFLFFSFILL